MTERKAALLVLGAGAWGTAIGSRLANHASVNVRLWSRSEKLAKLINESKVNQNYLPEIQLSENLTASSNLSELVSWLKNEPDEHNQVFTSCYTLQRVLSNMFKTSTVHLQNLIFVSLCKGVVFLEGKNYFPSEIIKRHFFQRTMFAFFLGQVLRMKLHEACPSQFHAPAMI